MFEKLLAIVGLVSAGLLLIFIVTTPPSEAGAFGILAVFVLTYIVLVASLSFVVWMSGRLSSKIRHELKFTRKKEPMSMRKIYYYCSVIALGPIIAIGLQSVGGVGIYELLLVCIFIILGCVYVSKRAA